MMPQKFIDLPSGFDLARMVRLGSGTVSLNIHTGECRHNGELIETMETALQYREWIEREMVRHHVDVAGITGIDMTIEVKVSDVQARTSYGHLFASAVFSFDCCGQVRTEEKVYCGRQSGVKTWGFDYYWEKLYGNDKIPVAEQPAAQVQSEGTPSD